ncbi:MAG: adenylate/guanylate cyclase domain-containing protein [Verrucomicrobiota bacterium]
MVQLNRPRWLSHFRWFLLLPIPLIWCFVEHRQWLTFLENKSLDWRFQFRDEVDSPVKIVYLDVDALSLGTIGNMPWSRDIYSRVAEALVNEAKVKAVGFDFVFSDSGIPQSVDRRKLLLGNAEFGRFLMKGPPVVLAAGYGGWQYIDVDGKKRERHLPILTEEKRKPSEIEPPELPAFETSADPSKPALYTPQAPVGLIDSIRNGTRVVAAWAPNNTNVTYYHMAVQLARLYWGLERDGVRVKDGNLEFVRPDGSLVSSLPLVDGQLIEVNWFTRWYSPRTPHDEFARALIFAEGLKSEDAKERAEAKEYFANPDFKNAVVLIGPVDPLLQDIGPTSLDEYPVPKVGMHGNLLKTIVSGALLNRPEPWMNYVMVFGLTIIVTIFAVTEGARSLFAKVMAVLTMALYAALTFHLFKLQHVVLPFTAPIGAALCTSFAGLIWQAIEEQKAKGRIKGMFRSYLSPQLVEQMIDSEQDPQLGGHDSEITAYFSDIQGFSGFSEILPSGPLVQLMNEYLTACTDIVQAQGGTLDKYIGDAVVAMFGAPLPQKDHAFRACVATQLVHLKLGELREKWKSEGTKWPEIVWRMQSRIGLNTGTCMIGNMGSPVRFNYTMMGDNVNLAARMESGAKSWGAYTMCTEATRAACIEHGGDRVVFRALSKMVVKGRTTPVPVYEIVGLKEHVTQQTRECVALFEQGLAKYYARDWDGALALFAQSRELEFNVPGKTPGVSSNPSIVYIEKIVPEAMEEPPPENWDGRYVMKEK